MLKLNAIVTTALGKATLAVATAIASLVCLYAKAFQWSQYPRPSLFAGDARLRRTAQYACMTLPQASATGSCGNAATASMLSASMHGSSAATRALYAEVASPGSVLCVVRADVGGAMA
ncbi:hypothetical protein NL676_012043 [Syzygium grande]|nr:hypothetical protein NL676_012043 [Syzygium grande]